MKTNYTFASRQIISAKFAAKATFAALALAGSVAIVAPAAHAEPVPPPGPGASSLGAAC